MKLKQKKQIKKAKASLILVNIQKVQNFMSNQKVIGKLKDKTEGVRIVQSAFI